MSLVAYGSSGESDEDTESSSNDYISALSDKSLPKKQRETVKITVPSLKEFQDEEEVPSKKPKLKSGCGLFSILPPPKHSSVASEPGFVPYILSKKKTVPAVSSKFKQKSCENENLKCESSAVKFQSVDRDSDDDHAVSIYQTDEDISSSTSGSDFFSLETSSKVNNAYSGKTLHLEEPNENHNDVPATSSGPSVYSDYNNVETSHYSSEVMPNNTCQVENIQPEDYPPAHCNEISNVQDAESSSFLNDEGFLKLQGRRRELENIDIIDVKADDQLASRKEWLIKSLTEEKDLRPSRRKGCMPTQQQKRKHQITYLAFQAKERELDLKNQWALNSRTRRETQAKYGF